MSPADEEDPSALSELLISLKPYLDQYGYWAVFGAILLEGFAVPMPGQTLLIVASFLASRGELRLPFVLLTAWVAAIMGSSIGYAIGRYGGRILVLRYGHYVFVNGKRLGYVETFLNRYGKSLLMGARFLDGLRQLNGLVAGMARMSWSKFLLYTSLGAIFWVGFWGELAYQLGERVAHVGNAVIRVELWLLAGFGIMVTALAIFLLVRRNRWRKNRL